MLFIVLSYFMSMSQTHAIGGQSPIFLSSTKNATLEPGKTSYQIETVYSFFNKRYSQKGKKTEALNIYHQGLRPSSADSADEPVTSKSESTSLILGVMNQLTSIWSMGIHVPFHKTKYRQQEANSENVNQATTVGNVEILSRETMINGNQQELAIFQSLVFPSEEKRSDGVGTKFIRDTSNFALTLGVDFRQQFGKPYFTVLAGYSLTFSDTVKDLNGGEPIHRQPGDEILSRFMLGYDLHRRFSTEIGLLRLDRQNDQIRTENQLMRDYAKSSWYNAGVLNMNYFLPQKDEKSALYGAQLQFKKIIAGKNTEDESAVGISLSASM